MQVWLRHPWKWRSQFNFVWRKASRRLTFDLLQVRDLSNPVDEEEVMSLAYCSAEGGGYNMPLSMSLIRKRSTEYIAVTSNEAARARPRRPGHFKRLSICKRYCTDSVWNRTMRK